MDERRVRRMTASQRELEALRPTPGPTPCPHCGRDTVTVSGVCRDCWRFKGDDGRPPRLTASEQEFVSLRPMPPILRVLAVVLGLLPGVLLVYVGPGTASTVVGIALCLIGAFVLDRMRIVPRRRSSWP
jgi:hypothetical protein